MNYKKLFKILGITLILSIFAYVIYSNYVPSSPKQIPLIEPDNSPTKVKPSDAGGIIIPNSDNAIYENMGKSASSRKINILPEPEQALALSGQKVTENLEDEDSIDSMLENMLSSDENEQEVNNSPAINPTYDENSKVLEEQQDINPEYSAKALNIVKITESNKKIARIKNIESSNDGKYKVQLASMKTLGLAISEGDRIKRKHQKVLNNTAISQKKVQQDGGQFFYIVLAGDYQNLSKAKAACKKLSARQQSCIIYHP